MNIYVVAWEYGSNGASGGGFDWYFAKDNAANAFDLEKVNVANENLDNWKAYRFTVSVDISLSNDRITDYIDSILVDRIDGIKKNTPVIS